MSKAAWTVLVVVILIIVAGGVYWFTTQNMSTPPTTSQTTTATTALPSVTATLVLGSNAQFPSYLTAANGMALYTFKSDTAGVSNCSGSCAATWPPYTVSSASGLTAGANIPGTIGTITRSDGTLQVTYNGMPLYFFAEDSSTGQVTGNGVNGFSVAMATAQPKTTPQAVAPAKTPVQAAPAPTAPAPAPAPVTPAPYTPPAYNY